MLSWGEADEVWNTVVTDTHKPFQRAQCSYNHTTNILARTGSWGFVL